MRPSKFIALLAFFALVPGSIWLAYRGHGVGLYPYEAVPLAFGFIFAVGVSVLFVVLPVVSDRWG